ncbi:hypothetical protein VC83_03185 [Pseudogymnoascus destructans]|uniref:Uncharacterized protein n=2 Tax=Pseudogymnoascus destructans TaxID=655981 RepID=L8G819_PSED2|nr:uncharacterized protein VC83_03185 [Pseudogymnoascus destructans]ELR09385.1 hypothetical protein GMDG_03949 [Pseudogymnoascus destructans 20631-21]OAF60323.1 hypothetical protein VC83_03185 [Pseudogymnoascus destructans]
MSFLFSIQDFDRTLNSAYGSPVLQIFVGVFGPDGAVVMFSLIIICVWHCDLFSMTSNSRMMFAFSRDGGIPRFFAHPHRLARCLPCVSPFPPLAGEGRGICRRNINGYHWFRHFLRHPDPHRTHLPNALQQQKGPFNLGRFSRPVALVASC